MVGFVSLCLIVGVQVFILYILKIIEQVEHYKLTSIGIILYSSWSILILKTGVLYLFT